MSKVTSVRLSEELADQLGRLAVALDRSKAWIIEQAVTRYIEDEAWQVQAIAEAMAEYRAEAAAGHVRGRDLDDVMNDLQAKLQAKLPTQ